MSRNETVATRYMAGATLAQIGEELGVTRERVRQILEQQGVQRRTKTAIARSKTDKYVDLFGPGIEKAFDETRNINDVVARFKGVVPEKTIRTFLAPRKSEQVARQNNNAEQKFDNDAIAKAILDAEKNGCHSVVSYSAWRSSLPQGTVPSVATITNRYGSWSNARVAVGAFVVKTRKSKSCRVYSDEEINDAVKRFVAVAKEAGINPSARAYDEWSRKVGNTPLLSTVRARSGKKWSSMTASR